MVEWSTRTTFTDPSPGPSLHSGRHGWWGVTDEAVLLTGRCGQCQNAGGDARAPSLGPRYHQGTGGFETRRYGLAIHGVLKTKWYLEPALGLVEGVGANGYGAGDGRPS